jgi:thioredoxin 1
MSDSEQDELASIKERKRERLKERHSEGTAEHERRERSTAPAAPIQIEGEQHLQEVLNSHEAVLVDCYADWCGPCQMMEPTIEALAAETDAAVAKVDVDAHQRLAQQLGAQGVPTFVLYSGGELVERLVGAQDRGTLEALLQQAG